MTVATAPVEAPWTAACMAPDEWADWNRLNPRLTMLGLRSAQRPCSDCPLLWAAEQRAVGRCNGTPGEADVAEEVA